MGEASRSRGFGAYSRAVRTVRGVNGLLRGRRQPPEEFHLFVEGRPPLLRDTQFGRHLTAAGNLVNREISRVGQDGGLLAERLGTDPAELSHPTELDDVRVAQQSQHREPYRGLHRFVPSLDFVSERHFLPPYRMSSKPNMHRGSTAAIRRIPAAAAGHPNLQTCAASNEAGSPIRPA